MNFFISDAFADTTAPASGSMSLLLLAGMFAIMYLFIIRPQVKRQKEHKKLIDALSKGDEVQTMCGLMGKIIEIGENFIKVEIAQNTIVTIRRSAVEAIMPKGSLKEM